MHMTDSTIYFISLHVEILCHSYIIIRKIRIKIIDLEPLHINHSRTGNNLSSPELHSLCTRQTIDTQEKITVIAKTTPIHDINSITGKQ